MKLYVFYPDGHGPVTFMVAASSEAEARAAVEQRLASEPPDWLYGGTWPESYTLEVYQPGEVAINDNG